ncbi:Uncharacterised protein [Mycobacteroides abscessus subsp. abscessus]|nr:Uncharacterised protein [Mycobacteroides abscessus subsp. abscessus]
MLGRPAFNDSDHGTASNCSLLICAVPRQVALADSRLGR